ncbi:shufflon system plasmid conjugative transfer pilus tip adhesin PilV [Escherichia coli]|nr:shufflon system plasmid conjugative transfer pilus tip adhesin PilV [Escherichia coli]
MKKYDRGWASLETGATLLIVMIIIAWGAGISQDYFETKGWQTEARLVSNWASAARSYVGKNYTTLQASSTTTTPAVITTPMLKTTGFLSGGFTETNSEGQRLQAYVVRNPQNPELLQAMVVSSGGAPYPVKALIQMAKDITTGLGGYILDGKTATGALRSWSADLSHYGAQSGNGHIAVLLSTDELSDAAEDTDRLYRFQVNGHPDLNKMHTSIDMGSNNLDNAGAVNARTGNFSGNVNGVNGNFSGQVKGNSGNFDVNVTAGGDIRSHNGWLITRNSNGWRNETHGGGFYMSDGAWVRSVNNKGIYTGGQLKGGTVRADGRLYTGEYLQLERTAVAGTPCSPDGLVGRDNTGTILSCQSGSWRTTGGKLKVTQLSTTGYLGQFDFCAIARIGNAEDAHYCQVVESPAGSRKWYKYEHKTGCIASCVTLK